MPNHYREIPENERRSFLTREEAWEYMQEQEREARRSVPEKVARIVISATADAIIDGVKAARDATRKK